MATAGTINIFVRAITGQFDKGIKGVHDKLRGMTKGFADIAGAVNIAQQAFGAASRAISTLTEEIKRLDEIGDAAERLSITADSLVKLGRAVELTGGQVDGFNKTLAILQRNLGDAASGQGGAQKAIDRLGLSAEKLASMGLSEAFEEIVDRISQLPTPAERASVAADLFGKSAANLSGLLTQGSSAIREATDEVDSFGAKLDEVRMKQIDAAQKSLERLDMAWSGLKANLAIDLAPAAADTADFVSRGLQGMQQMSLQERLIASLFGPAVILAHGNAIVNSAPKAPPPPPPLRVPLPRDTESEFVARFGGERVRRPLGPGGSSLPGFGVNPFTAELRRMIGVDAVSPQSMGVAGGAGAFEFGSLGAFQAIQASRREDESRKLMRQEVEESKKTNEKLDQIIEAGILALETADLQG